MDEIPKEKHDHGPLKFPENFLWGAATSAHQVEGNNVNSDWWAWEQKNQPPDKRSEGAADQYNRFEEDIALAKSLNLNSQRLSIEWARIEPENGHFDPIEIAHYRQVLKSHKDKHLTVMLTLWHFTLPKWVADLGGWENPLTGEYFVRFLKEVIPAFDEFVDFWVTFNEPGVYVFMSYLQGLWPPQKKSKWAATLVHWNLTQTHKKAYDLIHSLSRKPIGIAQNMQSFHASHNHSIIEHVAVYISDIVSNHSFYLLTKNYHDFLGINYYFHHRYNTKKSFLPHLDEAAGQHRDVSDLGWELFPQGLFDVLMDISNHKPIYITECGIASTNDDRRTRFLIQYLSEVYRAIESGVKIKGFFYWSLIDNFEWHQGFEPRFGLIEIDYPTFKRKVRPSAYVYSEIAKHDKIPHSLLRLLGHTIKVEEVLCYMHEGPKALCEHFPE